MLHACECIYLEPPICVMRPLTNFVDRPRLIYIIKYYFYDYLFQNELGNTPLTIASQEGHVATCALLIERGAIVDLQSKVRLVHRYVNWSSVLSLE